MLHVPEMREAGLLGEGHCLWRVLLPSLTQKPTLPSPAGHRRQIA